MKYCKICKVNIADQTDVCPLCRSVLEQADKITEQAEDMYPVVGIHKKGYKLVLRIFAFVCLIAMVVLSVVNYLTYNEIMWSIICDAGLLYLLVTLRYTLFNAHEGHTMKILMQVFAVMLLTLLIDYTVGYQGWSVIYAFPTTILVAEVLILVLMLVNIKTWQSYILLQMSMFLLSCGVGIYILVKNIPGAMLTGCAIGVSAIMFLGMICLGDARAHNEIKRRFRV